MRYSIRRTGLTFDVQDWLVEGQQLGLSDPAYLRGIAVLEHLLSTLTPKETILFPTTPTRSTQKHGYRITSPMQPMSKSPSMT